MSAPVCAVRSTWTIGAAALSAAGGGVSVDTASATGAVCSTPGVSTSATGVTYSPDQTEEGVSAVNVSLTGTSNKYKSKAAQTGRITQK